MESVENSDIEIRHPRAEDVRGMQEVFYRAWRATYPNETVGITVDDIDERFKDRFSEDRLQKRTESFTNPPEGEVWIVARTEGSVVGIISTLQKPDRNQIKVLYVHPDYWHKGIGTKLWNAAREALNLSQDTYVELADYNLQARRFYEKLGFRDTGRRFPSTILQAKDGTYATEMEMILRATQ